MSPEEEKKAIEEWSLEERKSRLSRVLCVLMAVEHRDDRLPELLRLNPKIVLGPNCLIVTIKDHFAHMKQEVFVNVTDSGTFFVSHVKHMESVVYPHLYTLQRLAPKGGEFVEENGLIKYAHDESVGLDYQVKCVQYFLMWAKAVAMAPQSVGFNAIDYFDDMKEWLDGHRWWSVDKKEHYTRAQRWEPLSLECRGIHFMTALGLVGISLIRLKEPDDMAAMVWEGLIAILFLGLSIADWLRSRKDEKMVYSLHAFLRDNILVKAVEGKKHED